MKKLCYILPKYDSRDATHFAHVHDFLKVISKDIDIWLFVEKGDTPPESMGCKRVSKAILPFPPLYFFEVFLRLIYIRLSGYKTFYVHYSFGSAFAASIVTKIFGGMVFYWNCGEPWKYKRPFYREFFELITYKLIDHLVTGAPSLADKYSSVYGIKRDSIKIMPNWIDLSRFMPKGNMDQVRKKIGVPKDAKLIFFAHRLSKRKGADLIIPIMEKLLGKVDNAYIAVAGEGPEKGNIKNLADKNPFLNGRVKLLGPVPNSEIPGLFEVSDVFLMPSREEGFPRVILESWAMGIPVVAADVGVVRELMPLEYQDFVVSEGDIAGFVMAILKSFIIDREIERNRLHDYVEKYNLPNVAEQFIALIS
ncbi:MAG: glycosyltransferase family 4 protein [Patescibacteria group bacterium]